MSSRSTASTTVQPTRRPPGPVPRRPGRALGGSGFGQQRAQCVGGHPTSLGSPRARRIRRKYKSPAVPTARSDQAPGPMCPPPAAVKVGAPTRSSQEHRDENDPVPDHARKSAVAERAAGPAHARAGPARSRVDQLHVPLHLRRLPRPVQARHARRHPGRRRPRVRRRPDLRRPRAHLRLRPQPDDPALHGLPARAARTVNLVVATLYIPFSVYNAAGESWSYSYFYGFSIGLEVLLLAFVLRSAWTWPRRSAALPAAGLGSEPLRAPQQA